MKLLHEGAQIESKEIAVVEDKLGTYINYFKKIREIKAYDTPESFINLPFDETILKATMEMKKEMVTEELKYILVVGIGGSDLGTKAVYDALYGYFDEIEPNRFPKMLFLETTNPKQLNKIKTFLLKIKNPNQVLINVISKSGKTLETIANLEILLSEIEYAKNRLVITTAENSELEKKALELGIKVLNMPKEISGRYSVFTNVGVFPLSLAGINITKLMEGAMKATVENLKENSPALISAAVLKTGYEKNRNIHNMFVFEPELESLGKWYEQLIAESIGKKDEGITPITSIGSTDLHSEGQLDLGGPEDKMFTFVWASYDKVSPRIPKETTFNLIKEISGKDAFKVERAILEASKNIYKKHDIPVMGIELENISPIVLGEFMQYKMIEIALLGKLFGINAFNQPNVEEYKKDAKKLLND